MDWLADIRPTVEAVYDLEFRHFGVGVTSIPISLSEDADEQVFTMGSNGGKIVRILDNYTVLAAASLGFILIDTTFKAVAVALPRAVDNDGMSVTTAWVAGAFAATVSCDLGTIAGAASPFTIGTLNDSVTWKAADGNWIAV